MIRVWKGVSRNISFEVPPEVAKMDRQELIKKLDSWAGKKGVNQSPDDPVAFGCLAFDFDNLCFVNEHLCFADEERVYRILREIVEITQDEPSFIEELRNCLQGPPEVALKRLRDSLE